MNTARARLVAQFLFTAAVLCFAMPALAQADDAPPPWIAWVTPVVLALIPGLVTTIKSRLKAWQLPVIATFLGGVLQSLTAISDSVELNVTQGALLGLGSIGLREFLKHWIPGKALERRRSGK